MTSPWPRFVSPRHCDRPMRPVPPAGTGRADLTITHQAWECRGCGATLSSVLVEPRAQAGAA